jgi:uncharacterized membrane protein YccC
MKNERTAFFLEIFSAAYAISLLLMYLMLTEPGRKVLPLCVIAGLCSTVCLLGKRVYQAWAVITVFITLSYIAYDSKQGVDYFDNSVRKLSKQVKEKQEIGP